MAVSLSAETWRLIEERMKRDGFVTADELLRVALHTFDQIEAETRAAIEKAAAGAVRIPGTQLDVVMLQPLDFYRLSGALCRKPAFTGEYSVEMYIEEKRSTEEALRAALSRHWAPRDDFEVAYDDNIAFTLCGGIYSRRIICREYLNLLHETLQRTRMKEKWSYDTVLELEEPIDGMDLCSFVLQGNRVYVKSDLRGFDFVRYFGRSKAEATR